MLQVKIFITPFLEFGMIVVAERLQRVFTGLVEVYGVFFKTIVWGQVHAATEPPHRLAAFLARLQIPQFQMHSGGIRIAWMQPQRHAKGLERAPRNLRPSCSGGGR